MNDLLLAEERLTINEAAKLARVSVPSLWRWLLYGLQGGTVKLESYAMGGRRYTTKEALWRFAAACTAARMGGMTPPAPARTSRQRERQIAAAEREFDALTS